MIFTKKLLRILFLTALLLAVILTAIACAKKGKGSDATSQNNDPSVCTHGKYEWLIEKAPTCSEKGLKCKKCVDCEAKFDEAEIAALAHIPETVKGTAPTCLEDGLTDGKRCAICKAVTTEPTAIKATGHAESDWIIDKVAELGTVGKKHTECLYCKITINSEDIPAIGADHVHGVSKWYIATPATCMENGVMNFVCECGKIMKTEAIAKSDHKEETVAGKAATCTQSGLSDGKKCSVCTTTIVSQLIIPAKGHSFNEGSCVSCGIAEPYGIWIVDGLGNPVSNVFIKLLKDGEQVKLLAYKGEFLSLDIEPGTYELELDLSQTGKEYTYDKSLCTLTVEKRSTAIKLMDTVPEEKASIFVGAPISKDYDAYYLGEGSYNLTLTPNDYTFFIFSSKKSAIYTITYECASELAVSYHGGVFFVQGTDLSGLSSDFSKYENGLSFSVYDSNVGADYVFAIRSESATSCTVNIKNSGEPGTRLSEEPWTPYLEDDAKVKEQLAQKPSGTYTVIDLTDLTLSAVFNEKDGYYHLNSKDGPIIFIDLTSACPYISSIQTICGNQRMGTYLYDVNGKIIEKRSYNELFHQYGMPTSADEAVSEPIRVPLTEKLAEAIKAFGDKNSWWAEGSELNIFTKVLMTAPYNRNFAWLLFCGYYA